MISESTPVPPIETVLGIVYVIGWPYFRALEWAENRHDKPQIGLQPVNLMD